MSIRWVRLVEAIDPKAEERKLEKDVGKRETWRQTKMEGSRQKASDRERLRQKAVTLNLCFRTYSMHKHVQSPLKKKKTEKTKVHKLDILQ